MNEIIIALIGGIIPALLWLYFWLKEDSLHPEPKRFILFSFFLGMVVVFPAFYLEKTAESLFSTGGILIVLISLAFIEELLKYSSALIGGINRRFYDEPIDAVVYMITAALGFAALENALFIVSDLHVGDFMRGLITGNLRFVGASLLHVLASGIIGIFIAFSFYKSRVVKLLFFISGLALATAVHALFNIKLVQGAAEGAQYTVFSVFTAVWLAIILLLVAFEKIKRMKKISTP